MSIINQMLEDLEARRAADKPALNARQIAYAGGVPQRRGNRSARIALWVLAASIVVAVTWSTRNVEWHEFVAMFDKTAEAATEKQFIEALQQHSSGAAAQAPEVRRSDVHPTDTVAPERLPDAVDDRAIALVHEQPTVEPVASIKREAKARISELPAPSPVVTPSP